MSEGIKETKEAVVGVINLGAILVKELKDGFQVADLVAILNDIQNDPIKKAKLEAALADIQKVPAEIKDITMAEGIELAAAVIAELPGLLGSLK